MDGIQTEQNIIVLFGSVSQSRRQRTEMGGAEGRRRGILQEISRGGQGTIGTFNSSMSTAMG